MAQAGCGSHTAQILDRDGAVVAGADMLVEVEWNRVLDNTSTARAVIAPGGDCCQKLRDVRSWRHVLLDELDQPARPQAAHLQRRCAGGGMGTGQERGDGVIAASMAARPEQVGALSLVGGALLGQDAFPRVAADH
ncbi:hypothetical protein [Nonomuraea turcica]|uniref:hypothetical protein n=1 Tax=Nonomuraea sp. G32 TaxID=3067274 RepID=UPI00273B80C2|nr:hypothetical protein [Nonomuraea sp. G32]MDP4512059.1 hypothetical protein [Nonomuraea sp. G32]